MSRYDKYSLVAALQGVRCIQVKTKKAHIVDPGRYRVEDVEIGTGEDATITSLPKSITCPSMECGMVFFKEDFVDTLRDFRMHWQHSHLPMAQYFRCNKCGYVADQVNFMKHVKTHGHSSNTIAEAMANCKTWEERNLDYSRTSFKLPWRNLTS